MDKRTGTKPYYEPMRNELTDCFSAIQDVSGSTTYGSVSGLERPSQRSSLAENGGAGDSPDSPNDSEDQSLELPKKGLSITLYLSLNVFLFQQNCTSFYTINYFTDDK